MGHIYRVVGGRVITLKLDHRPTIGFVQAQPNEVLAVQTPELYIQVELPLRAHQMLKRKGGHLSGTQAICLPACRATKAHPTLISTSHTTPPSERVNSSPCIIASTAHQGFWDTVEKSLVSSKIINFDLFS